MTSPEARKIFAEAFRASAGMNASKIEVIAYSCESARPARPVSLRVPSHRRCTALSAPADQLTLTGSDTIGRLCSRSPTAADTRAHSLYGTSRSHRFRIYLDRG